MIKYKTVDSIYGSDHINPSEMLRIEWNAFKNQSVDHNSFNQEL